MLIDLNLRIQILNQLEDPKQAKGIVKRGVTELVTPGLSFSKAVLDKRANNYLASIFFDKALLGIAFLDLSTGEFFVTQGAADFIRKVFHHLAPADHDQLRILKCSLKIVQVFEITSFI